MLNVQPIVLNGKKVSLEPLEKSHLKSLFEAGKDAEIWTYMPSPIHSIEAMDRLIDRALEQQVKGIELPFIIKELKSGKIVGSTRFLDISSQDRNLEIGWTWHSPSVWRSGINTETKYLLLRHCFEELGTIRVQFKTHHLNKRSQAAIERIGGVKEGVLRNHRILPDGTIRHSVYYSILDSEWPDVKHRFETVLLK